jgi:hypothetical protein
MKTDPPPNKGRTRSPHPARPLEKARSASGERWQEHARHAARGSRSAELDPARLLQARRLQPTGHFIRRAALERALRDAARP